MANLDSFRARFQRGPQVSRDNPDVAPLTVSDVRDLRLPWLSRFSPSSLAAHLEVNPGKALWVPASGEYVIAERWRHRDDIANIVEVTARKGRGALLHALIEQFENDSCRLVLLTEDVWHDQPPFYAEMGFVQLEKIVFFQRTLRDLTSPAGDNGLPDLNYSIVTQADLELLIDLDNNSFPWLWWNSREDMEIYIATSGVFAYIAHAESGPIGYASFTMYDGWAHLDRLAVISAHQGRKFGAAQLTHAMAQMVHHGARHVGLSTQENNHQSHRLYQGFGFNQTRDFMNIYGKWLKAS